MTAAGELEAGEYEPDEWACGPCRARQHGRCTAQTCTCIVPVCVHQRHLNAPTGQQEAARKRVAAQLDRVRGKAVRRPAKPEPPPPSTAPRPRAARPVPAPLPPRPTPTTGASWSPRCAGPDCCHLIPPKRPGDHGVQAIYCGGACKQRRRYQAKVAELPPRPPRAAPAPRAARRAPATPGGTCEGPGCHNLLPGKREGQAGRPLTLCSSRCSQRRRTAALRTAQGLAPGRPAGRVYDSTVGMAITTGEREQLQRHVNELDRADRARGGPGVTLSAWLRRLALDEVARHNPTSPR